MNIQIYKFPLEKGLKEKADDLVNRCFGIQSGADPEKVEESKNIYYSNPEESILYFDGEKLVGIQNIFLREVEFENKKILIGGLGGLCVDPAYRGRGIAKELLSKAMEELKKLRCDIGMLFTDTSNPKFQKLYGSFGFVVWGKEYTYLDKKGNKHTDHYGMVAPVVSDDAFRLALHSTETMHLGNGEW